MLALQTVNLLWPYPGHFNHDSTLTIQTMTTLALRWTFPGVTQFHPTLAFLLSFRQWLTLVPPWITQSWFYQGTQNFILAWSSPPKLGLIFTLLCILHTNRPILAFTLTFSAFVFPWFLKHLTLVFPIFVLPWSDCGSAGHGSTALLWTFQTWVIVWPSHSGLILIILWSHYPDHPNLGSNLALPTLVLPSPSVPRIRMVRVGDLLLIQGPCTMG